MSNHNLHLFNTEAVRGTTTEIWGREHTKTYVFPSLCKGRVIHTSLDTNTKSTFRDKNKRRKQKLLWSTSVHDFITKT